MKKTLVLILVIISLLVLSCNPGQLLKRDDARAGVDSVLFYQPRDVSDPFIDAILAAPLNEIVLNKTFYPPPAPAPQFRQIDGFRIQIFAGLDSTHALSARYRAAEVCADSIYIKKIDGLYKVTVGDYAYRLQADSVNQQLKRNGFRGAWVVAQKINLPLSPPSEERRPAGMVSTVDSSAGGAGRFRIQVLATGNPEKAVQTVKTLETLFPYPSYYESANNLYKVFLGKFRSRETAEKVLQKIRSRGYPDAWLVY